MEIEQIKAYLNSEDSQDRLKGLTELRNVETELAVPLLLTKIKDKEFLVRSFVAMGLGRKRNSESFAALLELIKCDRDPNVRAEAANSLSFYGQVAATHLLVSASQHSRGDGRFKLSSRIIRDLRLRYCRRRFYRSRSVARRFSFFRKYR